jgi:hypothetical protein
LHGKHIKCSTVGLSSLGQKCIRQDAGTMQGPGTAVHAVSPGHLTCPAKWGSNARGSVSTALAIQHTGVLEIMQSNSWASAVFQPAGAIMMFELGVHTP